jgi:hypothetical protein
MGAVVEEDEVIMHIEFDLENEVLRDILADDATPDDHDDEEDLEAEMLDAYLHALEKDD